MVNVLGLWFEKQVNHTIVLKHKDLKINTFPLEKAYTEQKLNIVKIN